MKLKGNRRRLNKEMASKKELQALIVLAGKIDPSLQKAIRGAEKNTKGLNKTTQLLGNTATKTFNILKTGAVIGAVGLGAAMVLVGKNGLKLASDLKEVQNVVDVTFGQNSSQINEWSKTALKSFGLGELAAKQYTGTLGAMMKSSGISDDHIVSMSKNLTGLAGDFASFYNLQTDEAFNKIRAGISGETEPLKQLGINMNVANLEAYALSQGIKTAYNKMSEADKTILRYNYLLKVSKDAQGDFARTQGEYANQQRVFQESFKEFSATIMQKALPAFTKLYQKGNQLMESFANDPEKIAKLQNIIEKVTDTIIDGIPKAISLVKDFGNGILFIYRSGYKTFQFIQRNWSIIEPLILGIVSAMVAWKSITIGMELYKGLMAGIRGATLAATATQWALNGAVLANPMTWIVIGIAAAIGLLVAGIYLLVKYWDVVSAAMARAWEWFKELIDKIPSLALVLTGPLAPLLLLIKHFDKLKELAGGAFSAVKKFFGFGGEKKDTTGITSLPKFALGGFSNRPSIFGEAGPEAAIPLKRTPRSLSILSKTAQLLGVGGKSDGGGSPTFIYSPSYGSDASESSKKKDFDDFIAKCEEWWESKRRESFG